MIFEVQTLNRRRPAGSSWVLVEKKGDSYFLTGSVNGQAIDPHISPDGFKNPLDAMRAAINWAEYLDAAILFVGDD